MRSKNTSLNMRKSEIWASPIIPNTTNLTFLSWVPKNSFIFKIKKAMELTIP